ncbi:MAG: radical SAM protein [Candidatus Lernaella stagnicola]|nr:radical SAM protein [Candidatus Lernaella stagnicola]
MKTGPRQAIVAVTYRCNARCSMCDIWRKDHIDEVEPSLYYHLPTSLREINLTGGEPFLRNDLDTIVAVMLERAPRARIIISSNGLLVDRITRLAPRLRELSPHLGVRISIDGDRETHDRVRGVEGAYDKAWASLAALRKGGVRDLGIGFTMVNGNEDQMLPLYDRAAGEGLQFTSTVVHSSPIFFGEQNDVAPDRDKAAAAYEQLRRRQLASLRPKDWFRAAFTAGLRDMIEGRPRPIMCEGGTAFFFLDPYGMVYPCHVKDWPMGHLEEGYDRLLARNDDVLERVRSCRENCWMTCTVAPMMRRDLTAVAARVGWDRLRALVRLY